MQVLIDRLSDIITEAKTHGLPDKPRAIAREYLQTKIIADIFRHPDSKQLSFAGGTALRLLRGLPRFSEDLDFDNLGLPDTKIVSLMESVVANLRREGYQVELADKSKGDKHYLEIKFPSFWYLLKLTPNDKEKLMLKVDYGSHWTSQTPELKFLSSFGFSQTVQTNTLNQLFTQKLTAYVQRHSTEPRDIFDCVYLHSLGAHFDTTFAAANQVETLLGDARKKFVKEGVTPTMRARLLPFIFNPDDITKLDHFGQVITSSSSRT